MSTCFINHHKKYYKSNTLDENCKRISSNPKTKIKSFNLLFFLDRLISNIVNDYIITQWCQMKTRPADWANGAENVQ